MKYEKEKFLRSFIFKFSSFAETLVLKDLNIQECTIFVYLEKYIYIFLFFLQVICTPGGLTGGGGRGAKNSRKYIFILIIVVNLIEEI